MRRSIAEFLKGEAVLEGAGVRLRRVFGYYDVPSFDPFLMLDDFRSDNPADFLKGFPWHPHRGIETITYVLKGDVEHGDSLGNSGTISSGDVQWMTAGSGIVHQEMPQGDDAGSMHGFQLWANLPARQKMMPPRYRDISAAAIPEIVRRDGVTIKIIAGSIDGQHGPMEEIVIAPEYLDCFVPAGVDFVHPVEAGRTVFIYAIQGRGRVYGPSEKEVIDIADRNLVLFGDGNEVAVSGAEQGVRFLLVSGKPLGEPVAWGGPIVMNTQEELDLAFREYQQGTFLKHHQKP